MKLYLPKDLAGLKKYRVGDYRILYRIDDNKKCVSVYRIQT